MSLFSWLFGPSVEEIERRQRERWDAEIDARIKQANEEWRRQKEGTFDVSRPEILDSFLGPRISAEVLLGEPVDAFYSQLHSLRDHPYTDEGVETYFARVWAVDFGEVRNRLAELSPHQRRALADFFDTRVKAFGRPRPCAP